MIEITKCMPGCTIQDTGRIGYRRLGVGSAGAVDQFALITGNALLGNALGAAAVEILLFPFEVRFVRDCAFAVTGAANQASLDGALLPPWWRASAKAGQVLRLEGTARGGINYLCVHAGIDVPEVLGSTSTDLKGCFGGFEGRMLKTGDVLNSAASEHEPANENFGASPYQPADSATLRVLPGFELDALGDEQKALFLSSTWAVSRQSNRIGYRLEGPQLTFAQPMELLSYGFVPGLIQLPPSGQPIVMLSDAQTCGGYPRLGSVIDSDLRLLAQSPPGTRLQLRICSLEEALQAEQDEMNYIDRLQSLREAVCP